MLSHIEMVNIFTNAYGQPDHIFFTPKKLYSVFMKMGIEVVSTKSLSLFSIFMSFRNQFNFYWFSFFRYPFKLDVVQLCETQKAIW